VLGFPEIEKYVANAEYFGATVGRYANRIGGAKFSLDGKTYTLERNENAHTLHGGVCGFDRAVWEIGDVSGGEPLPRVSLRYISPHGDQGFPGELDITVRYRLSAPDTLEITYLAVTDRPTVVSLTNHTYFNLKGENSGNILDHEVTIHADYYLPVNSELIPTGEIRPVQGTPFDFRTPKNIGRDLQAEDEQLRLAHGYDHNYMLNGEGLAPAARVREPTSGRILKIETTQRGLQFYSGNYLNGETLGISGRMYGRFAGFCLEPQNFPDAPNRSNFPSPVLRSGQVYTETTLYRFQSGENDVSCNV
jgi:aldose 1-epimerase